MFERKVAAGEQVMAQGDDADNFYVVASGRLDAVKDGQVVCEYDGHGTFGELALMYNCPRAASVVARTDALLWALEGLTFKRLLIADRQKRADVSTAMLTRMPVLNYLDQHQIAKLADALTHHEFGAGEVIFSQGELGSLFFLVEEVRAEAARGVCGAMRAARPRRARLQPPAEAREGPGLTEARACAARAGAGRGRRDF